MELMMIVFSLMLAFVASRAEVWTEVGTSPFPSDSFLNLMVHEGLTNNGEYVQPKDHYLMIRLCHRGCRGGDDSPWTHFASLQSYG